jgi:hypothetical protein
MHACITHTHAKKGKREAEQLGGMGMSGSPASERLEGCPGAAQPFRPHRTRDKQTPTTTDI